MGVWWDSGVPGRQASAGGAGCRGRVDRSTVRGSCPVAPPRYGVPDGVEHDRLNFGHFHSGRQRHSLVRAVPGVHRF
eukprot:1189710-Prorocentrum_minimum.AAC.3